MKSPKIKKHLQVTAVAVALGINSYLLMDIGKNINSINQFLFNFYQEEQNFSLKNKSNVEMNASLSDENDLYRREGKKTTGFSNLMLYKVMNEGSHILVSKEDFKELQRKRVEKYFSNLETTILFNNFIELNENYREQILEEVKIVKGFFEENESSKNLFKIANNIEILMTKNFEDLMKYRNSETTKMPI